MVAKKTLAQFVSEAQQVHGNKYSYKKAVYVNTDTKIEIVCKEHGSFWQTPSSHVNKKAGCIKCRNASYGTTTEKFIEQARKKHGARFDYSKIKYVSAHTKIEIVCKEHGSFWQDPQSHISGSGCRRCSQTSGMHEFVKKAKKMFGNMYSYRKVTYVDSQTKVEVVCKVHGRFMVTPALLLSGRGCVACSKALRGVVTTKAEFIKRANEVHGVYSYKNVVFKNVSTKVEITCQKHGAFYQTPSQHLRGNGCPWCTRSTFARDTKEFVEMARLAHGDKYDYSKTKYKASGRRVRIICPKHGEFKQQASVHIKGGGGVSRPSGCPSCVTHGYSKVAIDWIKYKSRALGIPFRQVWTAMNGGEYAIPGTRYKADGYHPETNTVFEFHGDCYHGNPNVFAPNETPSWTSKLTAKQLYARTKRKENKIISLGYNLVVTWEKDWREKLERAKRRKLNR